MAVGDPVHVDGTWTEEEEEGRKTEWNQLH